MKKKNVAAVKPRSGKRSFVKVENNSRNNKKSKRVKEINNKDNSESSSGSESGSDDGDNNMNKLQGMDPEFFEYLKKHDPELLNFEAEEELFDSDMSDDGKEEQESDRIDAEEATKTIQPKADKSKVTKEESESENESEAEEQDSDSDFEGKYESLEMNDGEGNEEDEEDMLDVSGIEEDDDGIVEDSVEEKSAPKQEISMESLKELGTNAFEKKSITALKKIVRLFKEACHVGEVGEKDEANSINDPKIYQHIMMLTLNNIKDSFDHLLQIDDDMTTNDEKYVAPNESKKWKSNKKLVNSFLSNLLHYLKSTLEPSVSTFLLRRCRKLIPYFMCFPRLLRTFTKACVECWESSEEQVRIMAFLCIHSITLNCSYMREFCVKIVYSTYGRNCKFLAKHTVPALQFMENCVAEIFSVDINESYQFLFKYIRVLADVLRKAIVDNNKETVAKVYNWQFVRCLIVLCRTVSENRQDLDELVYPLLQVVTGTIKLVPTAQYFPLRFHCLKALNMLAGSSNGDHSSTQVNVLHFYMDILNSTHMKSKAKKSTSSDFDLQVTLRYSPKALGTRSFQESTTKEFTELLLGFLAKNSKHISFPEICMPIIIQLRAYFKTCQNIKLVQQLKQILNVIYANNKLVAQRRKELNFMNVELIRDRKCLRQFWLAMLDVDAPLENYYKRLLKVNNNLQNAVSEEFSESAKKKSEKELVAVAKKIKAPNTKNKKENKAAVDVRYLENVDDGQADIVGDLESMFSDEE